MTKDLKAFTLAEVLITLGIIGVVAAITMPILIGNYQKTVWTNQLKKCVSTLEQGFQMALATDGVFELENTTLIKSMGPNGASKDNDAFFNEFKKYFKVIDIKESGFDEYEGYKYLNGEDASGDGYYSSNAIYFEDGSKLILSIANSTMDNDTADCNRIKQLGGNLCSAIRDPDNFDIDINGDKGPNQFGRDRFKFTLGNNGRLYPYGGKDFALWYQIRELSTNDSYWNSSNAAYWSSCNPSDSSSIGNGCAARIIENGWKMDY